MAIKEEVFFEGKPHIGDVLSGALIGATIVGLPLFIGAVTRRLWVNYRITNRRVIVTGGFRGRERSDIVYKEIAKLISVPRGLGERGDIVLTLKDGSRLEMRSVPEHRKVCDYILERVDAKARDVSGSLGKKRQARA